MFMLFFLFLKTDEEIGSCHSQSGAAVRWEGPDPVQNSNRSKSQSKVFEEDDTGMKFPCLAIF